ncbi:tRNA (adenine(58)-N(1))-methyltransferase catalytic subunit TRM61 [Smittium culicis]|uniref:tRNA (adenine(58)-N(1))-methyltransferase catalytic subunit TRM61 n=1 Tax=Smittium culicis TaxID=133412 RepID=A0A1R1YRL2_9FUNG|nr:tRNA (adenine(58)-N(1))-methyltransferase catalytic subunit TRM61 [Smittium culicis]
MATKHFHEYKKTIENGDTVMVYLMVSSKGRGYVYLLHPTPELWTLAVPHRTQILYLPDISFISAKLNFTPGKVVVESGTGSGSFSHSIARSITGNGGHLYTFEYHEQRVNILRDEIKLHSLSDTVTLAHRDVFFLDLPAPWEAIQHAVKALKKDIVGKICTFSPCIEQVQKTALELNKNGFFDIETFEVLVRYNKSSNLVLPDIQSAIEGKKASFNSNKGRKRPIPEKDSTITPNDNNPLSAETPEAQVTITPIQNTLLASNFEISARGHTSYLTFASLFTNL